MCKTYRQNLALNNLQRLIRHKTQTTKQNNRPINLLLKEQSQFTLQHAQKMYA